MKFVGGWGAAVGTALWPGLLSLAALGGAPGLAYALRPGACLAVVLGGMACLASGRQRL
ncbi:hypothetical protein [Xanthomonas sp. 3058]|uniref:hypothetical protein n=1 Tax=Xanthomonas sp. 3058 TaxID=3035314 RepID=UPI00161DF69C|nr:hypothetical protein [Xanthomonas sp. 3058]MBB5865129.1 hypothetical protein [Xanthomonas sp. 3058]